MGCTKRFTQSLRLPDRRCLSGLAVLLTAGAFLSAEPPIYTLDAGRHVIEHRNPDSGSVEAVVPLPESWIFDDTAHLASDGVDLYLGTNGEDDSWPILDAASGKKIGTLFLSLSDQKPAGLVVSRERVVRLLIRTKTDPARFQILDRQTGTTTTVDLPIGSPLTVTDLAWGPDDGHVFVSAWTGEVYLVSLADGSFSEDLATGVSIWHVEFRRATSELLVRDGVSSAWHVISWPGGASRLLGYEATDLTTGTGQEPRDLAPAKPWADDDGNRIADWYEARFSGAAPPVVLGDSNRDGVKLLDDPLIFYRSSPASAQVTRYDFNLDGHADSRDAEHLYIHLTAPGTEGGWLPSLDPDTH